MIIRGRGFFSDLAKKLVSYLNLNYFSFSFNYLYPYNYLPQIINTKIIHNVRFYITDDDGRILDLNGIDFSITVVIMIS